MTNLYARELEKHTSVTYDVSFTDACSLFLLVIFESIFQN